MVHVSVQTDRHQSFSNFRKQGIALLFLRSLKYYKICITIKLYLFLNINQHDALNFIVSLFQASTCFEHMCSSSGGPVSGIITPIGVMIPETV